MSRRVALGAVGVAGFSAGCSFPGTGESTTPGGTTPSSSRTPTSTSSTSASAPQLRTPRAWRPREGEIEAWCKVAAVHGAVAALTVGGKSSRQDLPKALQSLARRVDDLEQSVVEVVYPQYGGLTRDRRLASVMLVCEVVGLRKGARDSTRTSMTLDIRLQRTDEGWGVTEVIVPGARQQRSNLPAGVSELLTTSRLDLPREARLDLASGLIDPRVVQLLSALSERWRLGVHVLRAGHPERVFGTNRESNHHKGRAVDIWSLDQVPVIAQADAPWREAMRAAVAEGADEVGGPRDIGGPGGPWFTNLVHQDHVHLGFEFPQR